MRRRTAPCPARARSHRARVRRSLRRTGSRRCRPRPCSPLRECAPHRIPHACARRRAAYGDLLPAGLRPRPYRSSWWFLPRRSTAPCRSFRHAPTHTGARRDPMHAWLPGARCAMHTGKAHPAQASVSPSGSCPSSSSSSSISSTIVAGDSQSMYGRHTRRASR